MKTQRLLLVLAAILLIVLGVFSYLLASDKLISKVPFENAIRTSEVQSDSDEVEAIEKDLNETDLDDVDKELVEIEAEIDASSN